MKIKNMISFGFCAVAVLVATAGQVQAGIITYASRAAFDAANSNATIENWDGFSVGTTFANGSTHNGITYNSSTNIGVVTNQFLTTSGQNGLGRTPINFFGPADTITFGFVAPITAFGIDINTSDTSFGGFHATTNLGDVALSSFDAFPGASTGQFVGFVSDTAISSVTISSQGGFSYTLDTLRHVPEPASLAIFGTICLIGFGRRRKS